MRTIVILAVGLPLALAACAPTTTWVKPGASEEDLKLAQDECSSRSSSYDFVFDDRDQGRNIESAPEPQRRSGSAQADVYRRCMESQGWRRERVDPSQPRK